MRRATLLLLLLLCAQPVAAQRARAALPQLNTHALTVQQRSATAAPSRTGAFAYEALGGAAGSMAGFGIGYALFSGDCVTEELTCLLESAALTLLVSAVGAVAGSHAAGRAFDTEPSLTGATIGSLAGVLAGIGAWHLVTEDLDFVHDRVPAIMTYAGVHGVVTALGSRLVR
jgi:hypothetical protein